MKALRSARLLLSLALAGLVSIVSLGSTYADSHEDEKLGAFFGEVVESADQSVTLQLKDGEAVVIVAQPGSTLDLGDGETVELAEVQVGLRIAILAAQDADGQWSLRKGRVIPAKLSYQHRKYTVLDMIGNIIVARDPDTGEEVIVELESEPGENLKGQEVTFVGKPTAAGRFSAKNAVGRRKIVERLRRHIDNRHRLVAKELDADAKRKRGREIEALKKRLEHHITKQVDRFTQVLLESPDDARPALEEAIDNIREALKAAAHALDKSDEEIDQVLGRRVINAIVADGGVHVEEGVLALRTRGDVDLKVAVTGSTQVDVGERGGTIADIQDRDHVLVRFNRDSGEAVSIKVLETAHAKGRLGRVDIESKTITVELADGATLTLTVADVESVRVNGRPVPLAKLLQGTVVSLTYNPRTSEPLEIEEHGQSDHTLTVQKIDKKTRTLVGRTDDGREVRLQLASDTRVAVGDKRAGIAALKPGARINAVVDRATSRVLTVRQHAPGQQVRDAVAHGRLAALRNDIGGLVLKRTDGTEVAIIVKDTAEVYIDGEPAKIGDIDSDASLDIAYDPDTGIARKVVARRAVVRQHLANASRARVEQLRPREKMSERSEGLTASGTIAKIDAEHGALALSTHGQVILELRVSDRSRLFLNGEEVRSLRRFDRGFVAKALFTRTQDGNIVEELHAHGRVAAHDAARPRQPVEDDRAKITGAQGLSSDSREEPSGGRRRRLVLVVTLLSRPVFGAEVHVNGRPVGQTNNEGAVTFPVPEGVDGLGIVAVYRDQKVQLRLPVADANRRVQLQGRTDIEKRDAVRTQEQAKQETSSTLRDPAPELSDSRDPRANFTKLRTDTNHGSAQDQSGPKEQSTEPVTDGLAEATSGTHAGKTGSAAQ